MTANVPIYFTIYNPDIEPRDTIKITLPQSKLEIKYWSQTMKKFNNVGAAEAFCFQNLDSNDPLSIECDIVIEQRVDPFSVLIL